MPVGTAANHLLSAVIIFQMQFTEQYRRPENRMHPARRAAHTRIAAVAEFRRNAVIALAEHLGNVKTQVINRGIIPGRCGAQHVLAQPTAVNMAVAVAETAHVQYGRRGFAFKEEFVPKIAGRQHGPSDAVAPYWSVNSYPASAPPVKAGQPHAFGAIRGFAAVCPDGDAIAINRRRIEHRPAIWNIQRPVRANLAAGP